MTELSQNLGLVYQFPDSASPAAKPRSLHTMFHHSSLPTLAEQSGLARTLTVSMMMYHSIGWIHKAFSSNNILISGDADGKYTISQPFVTGFEYSRPDDPLESTLPQDVPGGDIFDPAQHPEVSVSRSSRPDSYRYTRRYDIYSLGVILLQIAFWDQIGGISRRFKVDLTREDVQRKLRKIVHSEVSHRMGSKYENVVMSCLDWPATREGDASFDVASFHLQVVHALESCHCGE